MTIIKPHFIYQLDKGKQTKYLDLDLILNLALDPNLSLGSSKVLLLNRSIDNTFIELAESLKKNIFMAILVYTFTQELAICLLKFRSYTLKLQFKKILASLEVNHLLRSSTPTMKAPGPFDVR